MREAREGFTEKEIIRLIKLGFKESGIFQKRKNEHKQHVERQGGMKGENEKVYFGCRVRLGRDVVGSQIGSTVMGV